MGFRMGRQTVDKPPDVAKQYKPGEPVLDEPDPWDEAVEAPKKDEDIPENIR
jgi:adenylosuccinate synthase